VTNNVILNSTINIFETVGFKKWTHFFNTIFKKILI